VRREVVITGVGAVTPLGVGAQALIDRWTAGDCGIEDGLARCDDFEPTVSLSQREVHRSDRYTQLAIVAADEAVADAGWDGGLACEPERIACITGTGVGGLGTTEEQTEVRLKSGVRRVSPLTVPCLMPNASSAALAMRYGLGGPNFTTVSACAAGAHAIGTSVRLIQDGDADAVLAGGIEAALTPLGIASFKNMGATSRCGISRPFDARRDGFVIGEGAAILVLEEAGLARARGARVLGRVLGYGATVDGYHLTAPEPSGESAARAIALALADAGIGAHELDYVNAHGTSTPLNDRSETQALKTALGADAMRVPVSSAKSAIGHTLGAAGAIEAVATVLALRRRVAPPTLGYEEPEEGLDLDYVPGSSRDLHPIDGGNGGNGATAVGISNSFGFGGHNAVLCLAA
jgi:3-oxoacyl-[acyl-carrier-protein] synthase II